MIMKIDDFFNPMEPKSSGIGIEYDRVQDEYFSMFGHNVPRSLLPDAMSEEQIISAMRKCISTKTDNLFELLGVEINEENLY